MAVTLAEMSLPPGFFPEVPVPLMASLTLMLSAPAQVMSDQRKFSV